MRLNPIHINIGVTLQKAYLWSVSSKISYFYYGAHQLFFYVTTIDQLLRTSNRKVIWSDAANSISSDYLLYIIVDVI